MAFRRSVLRVTGELVSKSSLPYARLYPNATIMTSTSLILTKRAIAHRNAQLSQFLEHTVAAASWKQALAALRDAISSGVTPTSSDIADVTHLCGVVARRFDIAKELFGSLHPQLGLHRRTAAIIAFLQSCAVEGEYSDAKRLIDALYERAIALHAALRAEGGMARESSMHRLIDNVREEGVEAVDPLPTSPSSAMLALTLTAAARRANDVRSDGASVWADAMKLYVKLRSSAILKESLVLNGSLVHSVVCLCEAGGKWDMALKAARATLARHVPLEAETYDALVRIAFGVGRFSEAVVAVEYALACNTPLTEASLRRGLVAVEEVCAVEAERRMYKLDGAHLSMTKVHEVSRWQLALHLFHTLADAGHGLYPQTYEGPLRAALLCDRLDVAMVMLDEMKKDRRWVPPYIYRLIACARIEHSRTFDEALSELNRGIIPKNDTMGYEALLRHCLRTKNAQGFMRVDTWMRRGEVMETIHKAKLTIVGSAMAGQFHAAVVRFFRLHSKLEYERSRALRFRELDLQRGIYVRSLSLLYSEYDIEDEIYSIVEKCVRELQQTNANRDVAVKAVAVLLQQRQNKTPHYPQLTR